VMLHHRVDLSFASFDRTGSIGEQIFVTHFKSSQYSWT
jgi:hypothetical protein